MQTHSPEPDVVLCVHGTFAADPSDHGRRWWQHGSPFWKRFSGRLPRGIAPPSTHQEAFHWSGANTERARESGAAELLQRLQHYESTGRGYHLIGHSHGGSLIWNALRIAGRRAIVLRGLRSWSTVGTPFLSKESMPMLRWGSALRVFSGLFLAGPCLVVALHLGRALWSSDWVSAHPVATVGTVAYLVVCLYIAVCLLAMLATPLLESWQIGRDTRLDQRTMELYGDRWLGLWSPDDEAINGLQATLEMPLSFVGRYAPRQRVFASDWLHACGRPHQVLFGLVYNRLLQPILNRIVTAQVIKTLQGNNRPGGNVVAVHPWPCQNPLGRRSPALPASICQRLLSRADRSLRNVAPDLRQLLLHPPWSESTDWTGRLSADALVHTSYFADDEVLQLLGLHLAWAVDDRAYVSHLTTRWPRGVIWFSRFKTSLGVRVSTASQAGLTWQTDQPSNDSPIEQRKKMYAELEDLLFDERRAA